MQNCMQRKWKRIFLTFCFVIYFLKASNNVTFQNESLSIFSNINCSNLEADETETPFSHDLLSEYSIMQRTLDCQSYFQTIPIEALKERRSNEDGFKLAFSHLVHKDVGILEIFLAVIYR